MKSILKKTQSTNDVTFPQLYQHTTYGHIVLFTDKCTGTIVNSDDNDTDLSLGSWSDEWVECYNTSEWTRLSTGNTVTLVQE